MSLKTIHFIGVVWGGFKQIVKTIYISYQAIKGIILIRHIYLCHIGSRDEAENVNIVSIALTASATDKMKWVFFSEWRTSQYKQSNL